MGEIVFNDPQKIKALNQMVHPLVIKNLKLEMKQLEKKGEKLVILDIPLLYEAGLEGLCNQVIVVYAGEEKLVQRIIKRDQLSENDARQRLKFQMSIEDKKKRADYIIDNRGKIDSLHTQVEQMIKNVISPLRHSL